MKPGIGRCQTPRGRRAQVKHLLAGRPQSRPGSEGRSRFTQAPAATMRRSATISRVVGDDDRLIVIELDSRDRRLLDHPGPLAAERPRQLELQGDGPRGPQHAGVGLEDDVVRSRATRTRDGARSTLAPTRASAARRVPSGWRRRGRRNRLPAAKTRRRRCGRTSVSPASASSSRQARNAAGISRAYARIGIRMPRDPRRPVRAPAIVPQRELLDHEHRLAAPRQLIGRGRTHRAGADDHMLRVECVP